MTKVSDFFKVKPILVFVASIATINLVGCFNDTSKSQSTTDNARQINSTLSNDFQHSDKKRQETTKFATNQQSADKNCHNDIIYQHYQQRNPDQKTQVLGCGEVIKLLKDDDEGSRHQKFLVKITGYPQITVLIAHNIDLAGRIDNLQAHTPIRFYGEYIYNDKGGVVHWTHKDPAARHQDGWLEYQGQKYW